MLYFQEVISPEIINLKTAKAKVASANLSSQSVLLAFACMSLSHPS